MSNLSTELINSFAKTVTQTAPQKDDTIIYGIVTQITEDGAYVLLDGVTDGTLTPVYTSVTITVGDRVSINVGNHKAVIIGNVTALLDEDIEEYTKDSQDNVVSKVVASNKVIANYIKGQYVKANYIEANYAQIDAANITDATIRNAWVNQIMIQTGLLANEGTVFYLDAVKVNAANITAGTIDVERLVVTDSTTGDKHMVTWNSSTSSWDAVKLDGDVIADSSITADKIVAHSITAAEITTQNLAGTNGWINLNSGTFNYGNTTNGNGISWDGSNLTIRGNVSISSGKTVEQALSEVEEQVATILRVDSSRGTSFKHNSINTVLSAVLYHGSTRIENINQLHSVYGNSSYLQWSWQAYDSSNWTILSNSDSRIGNEGFTLTISDSDVNIKSVFQCNLITPDPVGSTGATGTTS